jgi:hypothetical protein
MGWTWSGQSARPKFLRSFVKGDRIRFVSVGVLPCPRRACRNVQAHVFGQHRFAVTWLAVHGAGFTGPKIAIDKPLLAAGLLLSRPLGRLHPAVDIAGDPSIGAPVAMRLRR